VIKKSRFTIIPIEVKKILVKIILKGTMLLIVSELNGVSEINNPAKNAPNAKDNPNL
jgi:hypothetical protein